MTRRLAPWLTLTVLLTFAAPPQISNAAQPAQPLAQTEPPPNDPDEPDTPEPTAPPAKAPRTRTRKASTPPPTPAALEDDAPDLSAEEGAVTLGGRVVSREAARWTEEGIRETRARHYEEALEAFRKAASADPRHPILWNNLGTAYLAAGRPQQAESAYKKAVNLDPNYALAHYNLGAVRDARLDYDGAISAYSRALELDPQLANPAKNPPVVNNRHLAAVYLTLYKRQAGGLGGVTIGLDREAEAPSPDSR